MNTIFIVGIAAVLAIIIIILLVSKLIKSFIALLLIILVAVGAYFGVTYLDSKTNLRKNIPDAEQAFTAIQNGEYKERIKFIQVNYIAKQVGITVIYSISGQKDEIVTDKLLTQTRSALLNESVFKQIMDKYAVNGVLPGEIHVTFKFEKLDAIEFVAKRTASDDLKKPDELYGPFEKSLNITTPTFKK